MTNSRICTIGFSALALVALSGHAFAMGKKPAAASDNPVPHFFEVSPGIYRGGSPQPKGVIFLKKSLGVKTIISFESSGKVFREEQKTAKANGMRWIHLPISLFNLPKDREVDAVVNYMKDPALRPIFVHCKAGRDRTGLFIGLHRVENEGWQPGHAFEEMLRLGYRTFYFPLNNIFEKRTGFDI